MKHSKDDENGMDLDLIDDSKMPSPEDLKELLKSDKIDQETKKEIQELIDDM